MHRTYEERLIQEFGQNHAPHIREMYQAQEEILGRAFEGIKAIYAPLFTYKMVRASLETVFK